MDWTTDSDVDSDDMDDTFWADNSANEISVVEDDITAIPPANNSNPTQVQMDPVTQAMNIAAGMTQSQLDNLFALDTSSSSSEQHQQVQVEESKGDGVQLRQLSADQVAAGAIFQLDDQGILFLRKANHQQIRQEKTCSECSLNAVNSNDHYCSIVSGNQQKNIKECRSGHGYKYGYRAYNSHKKHCPFC